ncbi:MAG: DNA repair protein RecO [Eubacterium sp.]|nr:DNA repair protein RecO [Eubacterium sp.]
MHTDSKGIVLRHVKATSGRKMLSIFTQKYGKISAGTSISERGSKGRAALSLNRFTYGRYEIFKNREFYNINSGEVIKSFFRIGEDPDKYFAASYVLELTDKVLPEEVPQPGLLSSLVDFFSTLENRSKGFNTLVIAYEIKLLAAIGMMPNLDECVACGIPVTEFKNRCANVLSIADGGILCEECEQKLTQNSMGKSKPRLIYKPKFDIVNIIKYFSKKPISAFEAVMLDAETEAELYKILREYISYHMDISSLKSEVYPGIV